MRKGPTIPAYACLTPTERFQLAVSASARQDELELTRLRSPSPIQCNSAADAEAAERFEAGFRAVAGWALGFWEDAYRDYLVYCVADAEIRVQMAEHSSGGALSLASHLLGTYLGFAWFCDTIGCAPLTMLQAFWPPLAQRVKTFVEALPPDYMEWDDGGPDELQLSILDRAAEVENLLGVGWQFERDECGTAGSEVGRTSDGAIATDESDMTVNPSRNG